MLMLFSQQLLGSVQEQLRQVPSKERFYLEAYFKDFLLHNLLGHVVFFETKPACIICVSVASGRQPFLKKSISEGWSCWKKYEAFFSHPNFIFCEEEHTFETGKLLEIILINKQTLAKCLAQNASIFKEILGEEFSVEEFMTRLEEEKKLSPLIHHDECLLGIILGFGYE